MGGSISCISMVGISLTKLQSGSGPECNSPDSRGPPEKTRLGPSENLCFTAAVETAVTGINNKQTNMMRPFLSFVMIYPLKLSIINEDVGVAIIQ